MGKKINNDSSLKSPGKDNNSSNGPNYVYSKMNSESDHKVSLFVMLEQFK